jgi:predicted nucleic acid-binding protein
MPLTLNLADQAADLRARYRLSTPDAIQLASAIARNATRFYGNDRGLQRVSELDCLIIDDLI